MPASLAFRRLPTKGKANPSFVLSSLEYVSGIVLSAMARLGTDGFICGVLWVTFCTKGLLV